MSYLVSPIEGLEPWQVTTELYNQLHSQDCDLSDVTKQTFRFVNLRRRAGQRHVVHLLQVLLGRLLKLLLEVDQPVDQLLLLGFQPAVSQCQIGGPVEVICGTWGGYQGSRLQIFVVVDGADGCDSI